MLRKLFVLLSLASPPVGMAPTGAVRRADARHASIRIPGAEVLTTREQLREHFEAGRQRLAALDLEPVDIIVTRRSTPT